MATPSTPQTTTGLSVAAISPLGDYIAGNPAHSGLRTSTKITLFLIAISLLVIVAFVSRSAADKSNATPAPNSATNAAAAIETTPAEQPAVSAANDPSPVSTSDTNSSQNVDSSTTGSSNNISTQVIVNGVAVDVPVNGSTSQTMTNSDGQTTDVTATGSQSTAGTSTNRTTTHSHVTVRSNASRVNTNITVGGSSP